MPSEFAHTYTYSVKGTAAKGQTWVTSGVVTCDFMEAFNEAMRESFKTLTDGKAVYGTPGLGCNGPYNVTSFLLQLRDN